MLLHTLTGTIKVNNAEVLYNSTVLNINIYVCETVLFFLPEKYFK